MRLLEILCVKFFLGCVTATLVYLFIRDFRLAVVIGALESLLRELVSMRVDLR